MDPQVLFQKKLWEVGSKFDSNNLLVKSNLLVGGNKSVKASKSRNAKNQLTNVKSMGSNIDSFSFVRPQSMKESYDKRSRKTKSKKSKATKKLPYDEIKDKLFDGAPHKRSRIGHESFTKYSSFGVNKKSAYNVPITTSSRKKTDQSKSFMTEPGKKVQNRKLVNSNYKEVKKLLNSKQDVDFKDSLFKKVITTYQPFLK